ncbi:adenosylcobinamide-phosphate synthase [Hoeflea marina]|uniref:Cobalamin biosynthesis protein CobD n=1 Tax=Hoeflea marina TaxID=274592 RepID=A0A317PLM7_9HYPH|nr:adenosylcobinamide-phosphate synthase CbiB [Hoeflea marina]PWV98963.1 adenosylcobinamide-phosphate synthase [Hoeflea marina]
MIRLLVLLAALMLDRLVGDPDWLWRRLPHPVVWFGAAIGLADRHLNREDDSPAKRRMKGRVAIAALLLLAVAAGLLVHFLLFRLGPLGWLLEAVIVAVLLAQKSLADHVAAVPAALRTGGIEAGRKAVSMIVGRDPDTLDHPAVGRAALESLAENFSDGIVAPVVWYAIAGLPGLLAYKMLNTADSMIGHLNDRYRDFGRAAALLDDVANLPASRLSAALIACGAAVSVSAFAGRRALVTAFRDAGLHRSPNAGWPEAAMAGALGVALAGPRFYGGVKVVEPSLNGSGRLEVGTADIDRGLRIYGHACTALSLLVFSALLISVFI